VLEKLTCEGEFLDGAKEVTIRDQCANGRRHEYDDSLQAAVYMLPVEQEHLQWTKNGADRHQEQAVRYRRDHYRE
jgi:hypothetical protein